MAVGHNIATSPTPAGRQHVQHVVYMAMQYVLHPLPKRLARGAVGQCGTGSPGTDGICKGERIVGRGGRCRVVPYRMAHK